MLIKNFAIIVLFSSNFSHCRFMSLKYYSSTICILNNLSYILNNLLSHDKTLKFVYFFNDIQVLLKCDYPIE